MTPKNQNNEIPLSLYIHTPWCEHKCPYCDFNSHAIKKSIPEETYINCLIEDLKLSQHLAQGRKIKSIFIGGGTPSMFSAESIYKILNSTNKFIQFETNIEITMEANPGSSEQIKFKGFRDAGVNRLSIGVQSFNDTQLKKLQRVHSSSQALKSIDMAIDSGFDNFNIDLMFALPDQTLDQSISDLQTAIKCNPNHISWYQLTLEPNTVFHKFPPKLPNEEITWKIQESGHQLLKENGYEQYEISAFSKPGKQSAHNLNYWLFGDYIGIGAGAHGKISFQNNEATRHNKKLIPESYMNPNSPFTAKETKLSDKDKIFEFMLNVLRLHKKIPKSLFETRTGLAWDSISDKIDVAIAKELIKEDKSHFWTTQQGKRFLNDLQGLFL